MYHTFCGDAEIGSATLRTQRDIHRLDKFPMAGQRCLSKFKLMESSEANCVRHLSLDSGSDLLRPPNFKCRKSPRRSLTESNIRPFLESQHSFRHDMQHAAEETYLITRLAFTLLSYLGIGYRWMTKLAALGLYTLFLLPGFLQVAFYYFFSYRVERSIVYGESPRNRLDLYLPDYTENKKPVVIFVTGGAWIIGYKAWGSLLGRRLVERDIIVACLDYRNFPQGTIGDMVKDVSEGISFICNHIAKFGGDPNRIYLVGQSAGAHISACALVEQAKREKEGQKLEPMWCLSQIKAFVGISGVYNLCKVVDHFHQRGLYRSLLLSIMEYSLPTYSPEVLVRNSAFADAASLLPPVYLYHGEADYSVPPHSSTMFAQALQSVGVQVKTILYPDKTHTDLFLQDPLRGGNDPLLAEIVAIVYGSADAQENHFVAPLERRLVPEILLQLARNVSPF